MGSSLADLANGSAGNGAEKSPQNSSAVSGAPENESYVSRRDAKNMERPEPSAVSSSPSAVSSLPSASAKVSGEGAKIIATDDYKILIKSKDAEKHIVRIPKTNRKGEVKTNKRGFAKCKLRVEQFTKSGELRLKFDGTPKYRFTNSKRAALSILTFFLVVLLGATSYGGYLLYSMQQSLNKISNDVNIMDVVFKDEPLQTDSYGRSNILIFGTSDDDIGHDGADLADSIMILSINPKTGAANAISIPRDLTYKDKTVSTGGRVRCSVGSIWKVNVGYLCGYEMSDAEEEKEKQLDGAQHMADIVADITGLDIQYFAKVNYTVVRNLVDTFGGIDVVPYTDDPRGILDYAARIPVADGKSSKPLDIPAGLQHLDGWHALQMARARNDEGGYGLSRSNFDRELNQQIVLNGIRDKAANSGVLLNPQKLVEIFQALGDNIVTNVSASEFKSFGKALNVMQKAITIPLQGTASDGTRVAYVLAGESVLMGSNIVPAEGEFDFSEIRKYIRKSLDAKPVASEGEEITNDENSTTKSN